MNLSIAQTRQGSAPSVEYLLERLIDYAGLFPPASLSMLEAVNNYSEYSRSEDKWILGRFIVPVARLEEFAEATRAMPAAGSQLRWELSVLLGTDPVRDIEQIQRFKTKCAEFNPQINFAIESVEAKVSSPEDARRLDAAIPSEFIAYLELPLSPVLYEAIFPVASGAGRRLKIRMGGEAPEKFPAAEAVVEFLSMALAAGLPFKATAGLHHPIRSAHQLSQEPESTSVMMHGFLNVFLAAAFLRGGMEARLAVELLKEQSPSAFCFDSPGVAWRGYRLSSRDLFLARRDFAISFGSCSFTEPIDDLRSLHLL